ncbi:MULTISPECIES: hypothetical protein [unclassified Clostridium]|uniref:hypothetical protein n=1 Tax=unclassified Clostridium TaxID=2614128 RepID=UPI002079238A|nr:MULTISPECIES: hypothetical protein [unclassified Clostridium]
MKIKAIIVDEVPGNCEKCTFGYWPIKGVGIKCELDCNSAVSPNTCPLIKEKEYLNVQE